MKRYFLYISGIIGIVSAFHETVNLTRRIGGPQQLANAYPQYVVAIGHWSIIAEVYIHKCMGTLLSQTWVISAKHCFRDVTANHVAICHGDIVYSDCVHYPVKQFHLHETVDLAVAEVEYVNIDTNSLPKLSKRHCPADVRAVYHSWGGTGEDIFIFSRDLLFSMNDVNEYLCGYPSSYICFKPVDGTIPMGGDSGSGFISGYGPGPLFPTKRHNIFLIGVMSGKFERSQFNTTKMAVLSLAIRVSEYIPWITQYVKVNVFVDQHLLK